MAQHIVVPVEIAAHGTPPKTIREYVGAASTGTRAFSVARMTSPPGWSEPAQCPAFDEVTFVLSGAVVATTGGGGRYEVRSGEALLVRAGERVQYQTPAGAEYVAICVPAFTPEAVRRDPEGPGPNSGKGEPRDE